MCKKCVTQEFPDRGRVCFKNGTHMLNLKECANCGFFGIPSSQSEITEIDSEDEEEESSFTHVCPRCEHIIARHNHTFEIDYEEKTHSYFMTCLLCGKGSMVSDFDPGNQNSGTDSDDNPEWEDDPSKVTTTTTTTAETLNSKSNGISTDLPKPTK